jgi:hypothetical protein
MVDKFICLEIQPDAKGVKLVKNSYEEIDVERYLPLLRDEEQMKNR